MPIIKKVFRLNRARVICLPKSWFEWYERKAGCEIKEVAVEIDEILKIMPIIPIKNEKDIG